ncbi:ATP/GTP-binding protein [Kitasatospora sp. NPDC090091]|uniref:AAA family ATPase n=1 Tax=Kitasatospora sp. NPDC090091 TaxID=3364081 RepID=UPI0037F24293
MLMRFRVANHASLLAEQELSLVATDEHEDIAVTEVASAGVQVLPALAILGANASGKSNVLKALAYMRHAVLESHARWLPDGGTSRTPFLLAAAGRAAPSAFAVDIALDGVHYEYGFEVDDRQVREEWLRSFPEGRPRRLFERSVAEDGSSHYEYGPSFRGRKRLIEDVVRPNSLYLSAGAGNNHEVLRRIHRWFHRGLRVALDANFAARIQETRRLWDESDLHRDRLRGLLQFADLGITDLSITEEEWDDERARQVRSAMRVLVPEIPEDEAIEVKPAPRIGFVHMAEGSPVTLDLADESNGTRTWAGLLGPVIGALQDGSLLVVDELDARLHPHLAARLVALFQDPERNTSGAQLLFNTHDATLLAPQSEANLHRDQVYLAAKNPRTGATELTALVDFKVRDGVENLEKRYLAGRYGALPFFDEELLVGIGAKRGVDEAGQAARHEEAEREYA